MSDESKSVDVKKDQGMESFGNNAYFAAKDGQFDKGTYRSALTVLVSLIIVIVVTMKLTSKKPVSRSGKQMPSPIVSRDDPVLNSKLLTERDLINIIRRPRVDSSLLGKIKVVSLRSISAIPIGSEIKAILESGATDGIVKARLEDPLIVDGEPILPQGTVLFGKGKSGEERLMIEFKRVIFPSGEAFATRAQAFDSGDKILGLKGAFVGTRTKKMIGGMADGLQDTSGSLMFGNQRPSVRDGALSGASKAALDQSQMYLEELKRSPNIIEVKAGTKILVIIDDASQKEENESK
jgi:hypothetical protein